MVRLLIEKNTVIKFIEKCYYIFETITKLSSGLFD